jgi:glycosyltransferase involved in cell wall biosynthesis
MKILYITLEDLSLHKGSVVHVKEVVKGLMKLRNQVGLIARASSSFESEVDRFYNLERGTVLSLRFLGIKRQPYLISSLFLFLHIMLHLSQYDIIYARDFHTVIVAFLPRLILRKKLVFEMNGIANEEERLREHSMFRRLFTFCIEKAERMAAFSADRIVVVTPHIASYLVGHFRCNPENVEVVENGVDTETFHPISDETVLKALRQRLGIGEKEVVVTFVGNLAPWQGIEYLIQVAPSLTKRLPPIRFLIIGSGVLKEKFQAEVQRSGMSDRFIFTGMVDYEKIPLYINISDICLVLKRRLASGYSPIKLFEYMACGKPVLASRVEGLEFIEIEEVGLLTEPEDVTSIEKGLIELIETPQKRIEMGFKGRELAQEKFDWKLRVKRITEILEGLA